ncbi:YbaB/EbfC family nucleoid-associated protein [Nonomuraea angiospora]|uniref:DNA-binding protein YbaB n=1 Tax=Nonomuraea angiospora TaxID=46172 RepID=A0ABR9M884_9ACTN|nr:YbaB/EbfC family nucleoid-associated protein [Nonomuraea angiospora]MBE1588536.1 DNA-binding protein YbaB [Nonomuraea angiospora]
MFGHPYDPANIREQDVDEVARQGERMLAWLEAAQEDLEKIVGAGEAAAGQVKATVDVNGRVLDVRYGPRAIRLNSHELAEQTLAAVGEACADAQRQTEDLMREALPGYDPAEANAQFERLLNDWR